MTGHDGTADRSRQPNAQGPRDYRKAFGRTLVADSQTEARALLAEQPDAIVIVRRGRPRAVVFMCPDSCGDIVVVNVDDGVGKAWRLREGEDGDVTLMPSVWRSTGCCAHFIIWKSRVWWCRFFDEPENTSSAGSADQDWPAEMDSELLSEWRRIRAERSRSREHHEP